MRQIQVAEAKAKFSALLDEVEAGAEILIARRGKLVARLVPEPRSERSVADVLRAAGEQGGLDLAAPVELPLDAINLD